MMVMRLVLWIVLWDKLNGFAHYFDRSKRMTTRIEHDTFGPIDVPADKLWGAQTQRSLLNFDISGELMPHEIIRALAQIKRSCSVVNHALGLQSDAISSAIVAAADEVIAGQHDEQFPHERYRPTANLPRHRHRQCVFKNWHGRALGRLYWLGR